MEQPFYTIGHSMRTIDDFMRILQDVEITLVVDVRTVPRSRTNPQYNGDVLPTTLANFSMEYEHIAALGGLRGKQRNVSPTVNAFWQNESPRNYADYAMSERFRTGLERLIELGHAQRYAIMCAESPD